MPSRRKGMLNQLLQSSCVQSVAKPKKLKCFSCNALLPKPPGISYWKPVSWFSQQKKYCFLGNFVASNCSLGDFASFSYIVLEPNILHLFPTRVSPSLSVFVSVPNVIGIPLPSLDGSSTPSYQCSS